jgi:hypothetical protein
MAVAQVQASNTMQQQQQQLEIAEEEESAVGPMRIEELEVINFCCSCVVLWFHGDGITLTRFLLVRRALALTGMIWQN